METTESSAVVVLTPQIPVSPTILDVSQVGGNASEEIKRLLGNPEAFFNSFQKPEQIPFNTFGRDVGRRMKVTEISILKKKEEPEKLEGRVVMEIEVQEDMVNGGGNIHGGCSAFLIDAASSFALAALSLHQSGKILPSVSQALNVIYHSPATVGERLRLVNTTLSIGKRAESVRTEIWNITHHRLVASGVHVKMMPSAPPKAAL